jgi:enoyl-[acyl-carrier-protein] reductase (NADH)
VLQLFPVTLCLTILKTTYIHFVKVTKPLLETSRRGYLAAISASSYSYVSLLQHFLPIMNPGSAYLLCYHAVASTIISHAKINTAVAAFFFS